MAMAELEEKSSSEEATDKMKMEMYYDKISSVSSRNNKTEGKKRKRDPNNSIRKDWRQEQEKYYQRLLYTAQKDLRKQSKIVRTFECKKMIRRIKEKKGSNLEQDDKSRNLAALEESYEEMKHFDLELVVQECLRRLGVLHLDPKLDPRHIDKRENEMDKDSESIDEEQIEAFKGSQNSDSIARCSTASEVRLGKGSAPQQLSKAKKTLVERILKHKKMQAAMENWNEQVTEYRRWSLRQEEIASGTFDYDGFRKKGRKNASSAEQAAKHDKHQGTPGEESLFVCLGGGDNQSTEMGEMPHYGPGSLEEKKKNRPGQRARKAKAMAIEAKKAGRPRPVANSVNWRPKKQQQEEVDHNGYNIADRATHSADAKSKDRNTEKKVPANQEELHPSWAAKKEKKAGIVEFQGTKITF